MQHLRRIAGLAAGLVATMATSGAHAVPETTLGPLSLRATVDAGVAYVAQQNSWFGRSGANLGRNSDSWWEGALQPGLDLELDLGEAGWLYGRASVLGSLTDGVDAVGSTVADDEVSDLAVEDAFLGWSSGSVLADSLGEDALDLSFGRQPFELGQGFLISDGGTEGGDRAAYWLGFREAYAGTAIARLGIQDWIGRAFYLRPDDDPDTETDLFGLDLEYALSERGCGGADEEEEDEADAAEPEVVDEGDAAPPTPGCLGLGYYHVADSDLAGRDGLSTFDIRGDVRPLGALPGIRLAGELAYQRNGDDVEAHGWFGELGYAAEALPWTPYLSYRYAAFSGDDPESRQRSEAFDPLFYTGPDWGIWTQGEITGEWVLANSNLISHTVRLEAFPTERLRLTALYYCFQLDDPASAEVASDDFAQEIDLIAEYELTRDIDLGAVAAMAFPGDAAEELTGSDSTWSQLLLFVGLEF